MKRPNGTERLAIDLAPTFVASKPRSFSRTLDDGVQLLSETRRIGEVD